MDWMCRVAKLSIQTHALPSTIWSNHQENTCSTPLSQPGTATGLAPTPAQGCGRDVFWATPRPRCFS